jgi:hypothetical protein
MLESYDVPDLTLSSSSAIAAASESMSAMPSSPVQASVSA